MKQLQQWSLVTLCSLMFCAAAWAQTNTLQPGKPQAQTTAPVEEMKGKKKKASKKSGKKDAGAEAAAAAMPASGSTGTAAATTPDAALAEMPAAKTKKAKGGNGGGGKKMKGGNAGATAGIRAVLDAQTAAWNAGRLEEFMQGYWNSPELTFVSGGRKLMGYDATLDRYRRTYQADGKEMGKLTFADLEIMPLSNDTAFVRGQYQLLMSDAREMSGRFTLVFRQFADGWKVVHDHTSANQ